MPIKIDFVLPWVDNQDLDWQKLRQKYSVNESSSDANSNARFRDSGTLKYVLRSIEKNCPWYNKIYLITSGHYPNWLDIHSPKIKLVTHNDIYEYKEHLPVFNSNSIEMNLSNIQDLSEHFVYLNDDMIIFSQTNVERFFVDGIPVDFLCHGWIPRNKAFAMVKNIDSWIHSLNNNISLINKFFKPSELNNKFLYHKSYSMLNKFSNFLLKKIYKKYFWFEHWHLPQPYLKRTLLEVKENFYMEMKNCSKNRFRSNTDITPYLYRYWHLAKGDFFPFKYNDGIEDNIFSVDYLDKMIRKCDEQQPKFICFNDSPALSDSDYQVIKDKMIEFLDKRFSEKASFEL
ncbi:MULTISPECIES: Stealth CR1 domain-containing protein [Rodentibacter]|uniref:Stealth CR1 domain-containing protein n=1 Tax=Rodentibacter TaxID=1960084 RepID=UPI001CFE2027|nr:Stealth CR1 domain-containing protein [Rodentibacter sp. JRC1]GJI55364.1 glycosyl transferase [Rodentibacter sp. JRC1]